MLFKMNSSSSTYVHTLRDASCLRAAAPLHKHHTRRLPRVSREPVRMRAGS